MPLKHLLAGQIMVILKPVKFWYNYFMARRPPKQPDLLESARSIVGPMADICTMADMVFDAAFRCLKAIPADHPQRFSTVMNNWVKMQALYELVDAAGGAGGGLVISKTGQGREQKPEPKLKPGLAVPEPYHPS